MTETLTIRQAMLNRLGSLSPDAVVHRTMSQNTTAAEMVELLTNRDTQGLMWGSDVLRIARDMLARSAKRNDVPVVTPCADAKAVQNSSRQMLVGLLEELPAKSFAWHTQEGPCAASALIDALLADASPSLEWTAALLDTVMQLIQPQTA